MTVVFQQTLTETRELALSEGASESSFKDRLCALRRRAALCLTQLCLKLTGGAGRSGLLPTRSALFLAAGPLLQQARRAGRPLSLAVFEFSDLKELRSIYGSRVKRKVMAQVVARMTSAAGGRGLAARTGATEFTLVLPGADRNKAAQSVRRAMGDPVRIEIESDHDEIVLMPDFQIECAGPDVDSIEALHRELCQDIQEMRRLSDDRKLYLTRERERHSRPLNLDSRRPHPTARAPARAPAREADIPPTVPDSLRPDLPAR